MARVQLTSITPDFNGTLMAAASGDASLDHLVTNTGRTVIIINNTGVTTRNVELEISKTVQGQTVPSIQKALLAGERWAFGALDVGDYGRSLKLDVDHADLKIDVIEI